MNQVKPPMWCPGLRASHPLANGLIGLWPFWEGDGDKVIDLVSDNRGALTGVPSWQRSDMGYGLRHDDNQYVTFDKRATDYITDQFTVVWLGYPNELAALRRRFFCGQYEPDGNSRAWGFFIGVDPYTVSCYVNTLDGEVNPETISTLTVNNLTHLVARYDGAKASIWLDGVKEDEDAQTGNLRQWHDFKLGHVWSDVAYANVTTSLLLLYNRPLGTGEIAEFHAEPFALITPRQRTYFWSAASAGGEPTIITGRFYRLKPAMWCPGIRLDHPIANKIEALWPFWMGGGDKAVDLVSGSRDALTDMSPASDWINTPQGKGLDFDGVNDTVRRESAVVTGYPFSLFALAKADNATAGHTLIFVGDKDHAAKYAALCMRGDVSGDPIRAFVDDHGGAASAIADTTIGYTADDWHCCIAVFTVTGIYVYIDGRGIGSDESDIPTPDSWDRTQLGYLGDSTPALPLAGQMALGIAWSRALTINEIAELCSDPFCLIRRRRRTYFWATAASAEIPVEFVPIVYAHPRAPKTLMLPILGNSDEPGQVDRNLQEIQRSAEQAYRHLWDDINELYSQVNP